MPAATKSTTRDPSVWLEVNPRVNTDEPASLKAFENEDVADAPVDQGESDHGQEEPGDQEGDQGHRFAEGQDPVLGGVGAGEAGHPAEAGPDGR